MAKHRRAVALQDTRFNNARLSRLGIEPLDLSELRERTSPARMALPERVDFYMLLLVSKGISSHTIDFVDAPLSKGALIFVRPGQVQQWHLRSGIEGHVVLVDPSALRPIQGRGTRELELLALDDWHAYIQLSDEAQKETAFELHRLRHEFDRYDQSHLSAALIRQLLICLLLRIARLQDRALPKLRDTSVYRMFIRSLEAGFRAHHDVRLYAEQLGCSESTLARACVAGEGRPPKQVIDRRVELEAKRMLAHSQLSIAEIGYEVGFSEATNFVRFFRRTAGCTPAMFRLQMASDESLLAANDRSAGKDAGRRISRCAEG